MTKKKVISTNDNDDFDNDDYDIEDIPENLDDEEIDDDFDDDDDKDDDKDDVNIEDGDNLECNIHDAIEDDKDYFDHLYEETEISIEKNIEFVPKENRISCNRLTKYEMVRILGERTKQLTMGAKPLIKNYESLSYDDIAEEELKLNMIPFKIKRPLPNGKFEIWTLDELEKSHLLLYLK